MSERELLSESGGGLTPATLSGDNVPRDPATGLPAGRAQAVVLLLSSCLAVLGAVLLAPVLPAIQHAFAGTPGVEVLAPVVLTAPALMIGLTAPVAGRVVDRVGRRGLLVWALLAYAVVGTAPLWLTSLPLVVVSRVLVGLTEAAIMTCCTTLLADYFHGRERVRYFSLQTVFTTVAATIFFALGGVLGAGGWRTPFWLYAVSLPLAAMAHRYIWQPGPAAETGGRRPLAPLPWGVLLTPVVVSFIGGSVFYTLIVELSYRLDDVGVSSTAIIGALSASSSVATAIGAALFPRLVARGPAFTVPLAFLLTAAGLAAMGLSDALPLVTAGAVVAGFGNGILLPALLTWALTPLGFEQRGRGTGVWTSAMFIGQFFCPIFVLGVTGVLGGLGATLVAVGALSAVVAVVVRLLRPTASR